MGELETDFLGLQDWDTFVSLLVSPAFNRSDFSFPKVASEFLDGDDKKIRTCYQELSRGWSGCVP